MDFLSFECFFIFGIEKVVFVFFHFLSNSWRGRVFYFCTFCAFYILAFLHLFAYFAVFKNFVAVLLFFAFFTNSWRRKVCFCTFVLFTFFGFLSFLRFWMFECLYFFVLLYFCTLSFGWTVHMNFHAKSGVCSSKNGCQELWVLLYFFCTFLYFCILFGLSIGTFMQNLASVAQKMSELCSI